MASVPDLMELELSLELPLAPLDNPCQTGTMGMLVSVARLLSWGVTSVQLRTTGVPEVGCSEPPSTTGMLGRLETLSVDEGGVARPTGWSSHVGTVRQCVSGEHYELAAHNGGCTGSDSARVTDSMCMNARQTASAWTHVRSTEL